MNLRQIVLLLPAGLLVACGTTKEVAVTARPARVVVAKPLAPNCRPVTDALARKLRGEETLASKLDDPAITRSSDGVAAGFCDTGDVRRVIESRAKGFLLCFESDPATPAKGRIVMRWEINRAGKVADLCLIEDSVKSQVVQDCLTARISMLRFRPVVEGRCLMQWPFVFKRGLQFGR